MLKETLHTLRKLNLHLNTLLRCRKQNFQIFYRCKKLGDTLCPAIPCPHVPGLTLDYEKMNYFNSALTQSLQTSSQSVQSKGFYEISESVVGMRGKHCGLSVLLAVTHSVSRWAHLHFNEVPFSTSQNQWAAWPCGSGLWAVTGQGRWFCLVCSPAASASASYLFSHMPLSLHFFPQLQKQVNMCFSVL